MRKREEENKGGRVEISEEEGAGLNSGKVGSRRDITREGRGEEEEEVKLREVVGEGEGEEEKEGEFRREGN